LIDTLKSILNAEWLLLIVTHLYLLVIPSSRY
jgi:hypothetical protein